jgi:hypothetical protein
MAYKVQVIEPILSSAMVAVFPMFLFYQNASTLPAAAFLKKKDDFQC